MSYKEIFYDLKDAIRAEKAGNISEAMKLLGHIGENLLFKQCHLSLKDKKYGQAENYFFSYVSKYPNGEKTEQLRSMLNKYVGKEYRLLHPEKKKRATSCSPVFTDSGHFPEEEESPSTEEVAAELLREPSESDKEETAATLSKETTISPDPPSKELAAVYEDDEEGEKWSFAYTPLKEISFPSSEEKEAATDVYNEDLPSEAAESTSFEASDLLTYVPSPETPLPQTPAPEPPSYEASSEEIPSDEPSSHDAPLFEEEALDEGTKKAEERPDEPPLLNYAAGLLKAHDYVLTEENMLSLSRIISQLNTEYEVKKAVEKIIARAEERSIKSLFFVVMSGEYDKSDLLNLTESDFQL